MGLAAAAVTFRKEPDLTEKAAWMLLFTLLLAAEISNLYIGDAEQAKKFRDISDALETTGTNLRLEAGKNQKRFEDNLHELEELKGNQHTTYKETETNIRRSSSLLLQHVKSGLVPIKSLNIVIVLDAPQLTSAQFRHVTDDLPPDLEGYHLAQEALLKIICGERNSIKSAEFRLGLSGLPRLDYVLRRKISEDVCMLDSSIETYDADGNSSNQPVTATIYSAKMRVGGADRGIIVLSIGVLQSSTFSTQPLYGDSFGDLQFASLVFSGEDIVIERQVNALEPSLPSSVAVNVQVWYSVPSAYQDESHPSFERIWYLERADPYELDGARRVEYPYVR